MCTIWPTDRLVTGHELADVAIYFEGIYVDLLSLVVFFFFLIFFSWFGLFPPVRTDPVVAFPCTLGVNSTLGTKYKLRGITTIVEKTKNGCFNLLLL